MGDIADQMYDDMMDQEFARGTGADIDPERDQSDDDEERQLRSGAPNQ